MSHIVSTGGMSESAYQTETQQRMVQEKLGNYSVLFVGPWTPEKLRATCVFCHEHGIRLVMDEMLNRLTGGFTDSYASCREEVMQILREFADIFDGSLLMCEYGGLRFYWPQSTVEGSLTQPRAAADFAEAAADTENCMREAIAFARKNGIPPPYVCIEACGVCASFLYRAGIDRVDYEVIYSDELERGYAALKGASLAFGKSRFGVDMAMVWYGGNQHDALWGTRWRTSLFHAFLRGADPIYAEHGVMDYKALGKNLATDHPDVVRFRRALAEVTDFAKRHPRPDGFPEAALAVVHGRYDGFSGAGQTHLWGQRADERFRVGAPERSWTLFERLYRRREWQDRDQFGDRDFSGNPPLGQADIVPFDAPDALFGRYRALIFLGRNVMDRALYRKLVEYVRGGGQLLMTAAHLNASTRPDEYIPFNGGDWSELFGVTALPGESRCEYGLKFKQEPTGCRWRFPLWSACCDPKFTDGGFRTCHLHNDSAEELACASRAFVETWQGLPGVLFSKNIGNGCAILVNSTEYPGADGLQSFYGFLMDACAAAIREWPAVECSDRVRYAVYGRGAGGVMYLLNTEAYQEQTATVFYSESASETLRLLPGEMRELRLP